MFDVDTYLAKLGHTGSREPTLDLLRDLHKRHLIAVPFDNALNHARGLDIWEHVDIDVDQVFDAVIVGGRGGVCHEISGLFRNLLRRLGFDVVIMSAGVRMVNGAFGPTREHMFHVVRLGDERWIVDVGFAGPSFIEPIRLAPGVQEQYGCEYELHPDGPAWILHRRARDGQWQSIYRFLEKERELAEWRGDPDLREYARELTQAETLIRGRATGDGQLTLIGRRFTRVADGVEQVRVLVKADDYQRAVDDILQPAG
ncbi:arylamine N-acetyltransferase family protein [Catellatospora vulcania]|uniref:arylamine N-acetyltransferase family protein n=1 Tax=Catellatospora vulcania TaxID=1460450 RepID=UPI0012D4A4A1|nr:arylamine N-acetyltransferase [Catellatospora vulcania]